MFFSPHRSKNPEAAVLERSAESAVTTADGNPKKLRVAVFLNDMNASGGLQRVAANLVRDLRPTYETMLLTVEPIPAGPVFQAHELDFHSLGVRRGANSRIKLVLELAKIGRHLNRFVRQQRVDVVLAFWYDMAAIAAYGVPKSATKIACEHIQYWEASAKWRWIRAKAYRRLDAVVALTAGDLKYLTPLNPASFVIANAAPVVQAAPASGREKTLLTVGHLISRKGIDRLLWALRKPLLDNPGWKLVCVGGGEKSHIDWGYMDYVSTLLHLLQLEGRVEFHPATPRIADYYQTSAMYVMGSRQEGLPMVLLEAKAYGLPIVAFDCPTGPREIVRDGVDGFLIKDDSIAFADAVGQLMTDETMRLRMSAAARADAKARFSTDAIIRRWTHLIDGLRSDVRPEALAARLDSATATLDQNQA